MTVKHIIVCDSCGYRIEEGKNIRVRSEVISSGAPNVFKDVEPERDYHEDCYKELIHAPLA